MAGLDVPAIVTEKLSKRYGSIQALVDLDLSVNRGEIFGSLGPNGAGKSTTIRLLLGYLRPTAGRAAILGLDSQRQHIEILRHVGYLPGNAVFEVVVTGLQALDDLAGVAGAKPSRRSQICEWVRLDGATLRRKVRDYSKGTRRKLGVVQALQHDPEVIIMDEPTEGLDPPCSTASTRCWRNCARKGRRSSSHPTLSPRSSASAIGSRSFARARW
jgi:ABC-2 type transport system ATP-binding protein